MALNRPTGEPPYSRSGLPPSLNLGSAKPNPIAHAHANMPSGVRSEKETLIVKLYDEDRIGKDDFIGQALVPLSDISLDGTPMGFDLTLQLHTKQQPTGGATRASVAVELTFNPLS